jgi:hypothetical protein
VIASASGVTIPEPRAHVDTLELSSATATAIEMASAIPSMQKAATSQGPHRNWLDRRK